MLSPVEFGRQQKTQPEGVYKTRGSSHGMQRLDVPGHLPVTPWHDHGKHTSTLTKS
jgi:hypothetical protein